MKNDIIINYRLFLAELAMQSNKLSEKTVDDILVKYDDDKIVDIINKLDKIRNDGNNLQEFIGLTIIGVISLLSYMKKKAEKARDLYYKEHVKFCDHLIGDEKKKCLKDLKRKSQSIKVSYFKNNIKRCENTNDPARCRKLMKLELSKLSKKIKL